MDSRHNVGTNPWNEAAVPVVRSGTHHRSIGKGTDRRAPETIGDGRGDDCYQKRRLERGTEESSSKNGGSQPGPRTSDATATGTTEKGVG